MVPLLRRLTEGDHVWGTADVSPVYGGPWRQVFMTVYSPGTTAEQRRLFHAVHSWPITGAFLGLAPLVVAGSSWPPTLEFSAGIVIYAAGFWFGARLMRPFRGRLRSLSGTRVWLDDVLEEHGDAVLIRVTMSRFAELDARLQAGVITPARYEAEWGEIYDTLPSPAPGRFLGRVGNAKA